jgi:hypothetical protein
MKVYHPPSLRSRCSYSIDEDKDDTDIGIKLVKAKLTYKAILNFSIDDYHIENEHYHHTIESHRTSLS